jgi:hypothetical protein
VKVDFEGLGRKPDLAIGDDFAHLILNTSVVRHLDRKIASRSGGSRLTSAAWSEAVAGVARDGR